VEPAHRDLEAYLAEFLDGLGAAVVDLSAGRTVVRMTGHEARYVLAKGCGLNVHPRALHADRSAQTALFHVDALIDCVDDLPAFDIYAARSLGLSLWQSLRQAAAEYGYRVR
jgi:sarcosine oxidase subunit gamma